MTGAKRPYVICHMVPSIDGRIVLESWKTPPSTLAEYERLALTFGADAWIVGRISMEPYAGKSKVPARKTPQPIPRTDFIARREAESYAIALDPSGKLTWKSNVLATGEQAVTILTEAVSDDYLAFLRARGVSYLFGGKTELNLKKVLEKLRKELGIKKLLLEGGGKINGTFLAEDLIDELSVLLVPVADGAVGTPSLFDVREGKGPARHLKLVSIEKRKGDMVWLRYKLKR